MCIRDRADLLTDGEYKRMVELMTTLNKYARDCMVRVGAHACTDITGFGFLGHAYEMAAGSGMTLVIDSRRVPVEKKALELAQEGIIPGGAYNNRGYLQDDVEMGSGVSLELSDVLYDPQTAGGLLISLPEHKAPELLRQLEEFTGDARLVGYVKPFDGKSIVVK